MRATTLTLILALAGFMPAASVHAQSSGSGQSTGSKPGNVNQGGDNSGNNSGGSSGGSSSSGGSGQTTGGQPAGDGGGSGQAGGGVSGGGASGGGSSSGGSGQTAGGQPGGDGSGGGSGQGGGQPPSGGGQASADLLDATNPDALVAIMRDLGYRTTLKTDSSGDPMIESKVAGLNTTIFFYRCTDHKDCKLIQFSTAFNTGGKGSPAKMAEWNKGHMLGVASLDSDFDPVIQMTVNMFGGISHENFNDTVDWWDVVLTEFKEHIDF